MKGQFLREKETFCLYPVFSDHCVLQRDKEIHLFGEGRPGVSLRATLILDGQVVREGSTVIEEGSQRFLITLPAVASEHGLENYELHITDGETETIYRDVVFGEVYLAGGQSNMELELQNALDGKQILATEKNCRVRFYYTRKESYLDQAFFDHSRTDGWTLFSKEDAKAWSAVGFFFARELSNQLDCPVGIIGCNWGGTSASAWMRREVIAANPETRSYVTEYEEAIAGKEEEEQIVAYDTYLAKHTEWDRRCGELYTKNPEITWDEVQTILGPCLYPGPMNCKNPYRPGGLHETMLSRVCPYGLRGVIYYQGESDDHKPESYHALFTDLIREWRAEFMDEELPFLYVQLPMHRYKGEPDKKNWPIIRKAQMEVCTELPKCYVAVCIDQGEWNEIHPKEKRIVANRLARLALFNLYGKGSIEESYGPAPAEIDCVGDQIIISMANAKEGLLVQPTRAEESLSYLSIPEAAKGFEVKNEAGEYFPATEVRVVNHTVTLRAEGIEKPCGVRYLWTNYGTVWFYNQSKLPLAPFELSCDS